MLRYKLIAAVLLVAGAVTVSCTRKQDIKPTRNVILMIPDGTSTSVLGVVRWMKEYRAPQNGGASLSFDPYICGLVRQYCSDAPVIESSAAMTSFMTGYRVQGPTIGIYPGKNEGQDIVNVNPDSTWQPLATVFEAAKILENKSLGLVVTVKASHATPAGTSSHVVSRNDDYNIIRQMASNRVDLVFGGGTKYMSDDVKDILSDNGINYVENDMDAFRNLKDSKTWALFAEKDLAFELDRNPGKEPSLSEMTSKAIELLSKDKNGFFLMVEGSKVDYAAHSNDPIGIISEFEEFDNAVKEALDFARKDGNTTVIVIPDHGNSGMTIGDRYYYDYSEKGLDSAFVMLPHYKATAVALANRIRECRPSEVKTVFKEATDIDLTPKEEEEILDVKNKIEQNYMNVSYSYNLTSAVTDIMNSHTHIGYVSGSHTSEDVFLAVYNPNGQTPRGWMEGTSLTDYIAGVLGLPKTLDALTGEIYIKSDVLLSGHQCSISGDKDAVLSVDGGKVLIPGNRSYIIKDSKKIPLNSVSIYIPQNGNFYISKEVLNYI